jgi:hypothetical protein
MSGPITPITTAPAAFIGIVEKINEVIAANPPLEAGKGIKITYAAENRLISVLPTAPLAPLPFTLYNASEGATLKVGIAPGLVNQISPTYTGATAGTGGTLLLSSVPPPLKTISATTYFWLKCVGTFGANDTYVVTVESNTTGSVPAAESITGTGFTSCLYLGDATVASGAITAINSALRSSLGVESYGNVNNWWALS